MQGDPLFQQPALAASGDEDQPLTVTQLTRQIKDLLEGSFPSLWMVGEISDLSRPRSGHVYLTLKDDSSQIRAVLWRSTAQKLSVDLHDGLEVICQGGLDVYAPRGSYQLVIRRLLPKGVGALEQALRRLKEKLTREGLFDPAHKQPLPAFPRKIAVVTSPTGAAIHDFLQVVRRRYAGVQLLVVPVRVQGAGAAEEIAAGIRLVNRLKSKVDVMIVGRGGGSMEDLWCFNEEAVVRAIYKSQVPVVSAVGHEIDVTLADLAADVRALTPSEAAERVVPDTAELTGLLTHYQQRLLAGLRGRAATARSRVEALAASRVFRRPFDTVRDHQRRLDEWNQRAHRAIRTLADLAGRQTRAAAAQLESLSPLAVLGRGYSVTRRLHDGKLIRDAKKLTTGEQIVTRFQHGETVSRVEQIRKQTDSI
ncbi:MAG: exodeoxyribonuclease VII large subunit [Planctomycetales bacterium]|nr:exodeoxyribonuclease VII large subunit [Planctomycetales bacterium]NIM09264.1 exodeoxyribonuclease VII large subunit [Planctomycetales bacterium]NIN08732.1 exodeoxyribonuclease VII large subunit [Planctomycetales bacterium]NIN77851.1 exodeoxyribonuclease VII large subunit [Planctomycetales bacterium]NIO35034.1 exodeoxyribonuclease VII large subunit [Planctomycetales bacterium]